MTMPRFLAMLALVSSAVVATARTEPAVPTGVRPSDAEIAAWFKFRQSKFAELKAAAPNQPAEIAALKARTAVAIAAAGPPGAVDQPSVTWASVATPLVVYDDPAAPRMLVVPAGDFTMGAPASEPGRAADEGPRRRVRIGYPLAVSMFPVVYGEYALFVADTHRPGARCVGDGTVPRDWRSPGYPVTVRHPATCVDHADALAYAAWLTRKTGHRYRLLSEAEYEYVNRAGTRSAYWWGDAADRECAHANAGGAAAACHAGVAPVSSYKPNAFGLFDTNGNVASWTADCWRAAQAKGCRFHAVRGGSWASGSLRSASREGATEARADLGFRVAREL